MAVSGWRWLDVVVEAMVSVDHCGNDCGSHHVAQQTHIKNCYTIFYISINNILKKIDKIFLLKLLEFY